MADKPKKGDIVLIEGVVGHENGVIGRVFSYDETIVELEWPEKLSPYNFTNPQPFLSTPLALVKFRTVQVLSPEEIFTKMLEMRKKTVLDMKNDYQQLAAEIPYKYIRV